MTRDAFQAGELTDEDHQNLHTLMATLDLDPKGDNLFQAPTPSSGGNRVYGGLVAGQCLRAACMTVDPERMPHSFHAYFTRRGKPGTELFVQVQPTRDGRTFATRHVSALQDGEPILEMMVSFQKPESGPDHQFGAMPDVPGPEELSPFELFWSAGAAFDLRPVFAKTDGSRPSRLHPFWIRLRTDIGYDPITASCLLVYLSDMGIMGVAAVPGVELNRGGSGSLDHSVWFHRPYDPRAWLLYTAEPISNGGARGTARGSLFSADGRLVASLAQEALLRPL